MEQMQLAKSHARGPVGYFNNQSKAQIIRSSDNSKIIGSSSRVPRERTLIIGQICLLEQLFTGVRHLSDLGPCSPANLFFSFFSCFSFPQSQ